MSNPRAGGIVTTRTKIRTPGPQMGNMTIDAYQAPRDLHRDRSGTESFPGTANMYTMRIDEHEICLSFRDLHGLMPTGFDSDVYRGHMGTPVFTNLTGLPDKYWIMNKCYVVGVAKSHTTLDDRGTKEFSQLAIYIGGTTSVVNNGPYAIPNGCEVRVTFYDNIHDREMYEKLFRNTNMMDGEHERPLAVVEPYYGEDNIVDTMMKHLPIITGAPSEIDESGLYDEYDEDWKNRQTFTAILERIDGSVKDLFAFSVALASVFVEFMQDGDINIEDITVGKVREVLIEIMGRGDTDRSKEILFSSFLLNAKRSGIKIGEGIAPEKAEKISRLFSTMLFSRAKGNDIKPPEEDLGVMDDGQRKFFDLISKSQKGARDLLHHQNDLIKWDRRWVIGTALETSNPGDRLNIKLNRS